MCHAIPIQNDPQQGAVKFALQYDVSEINENMEGLGMNGSP
jgi:hypothetical protein